MVDSPRFGARHGVSTGLAGGDAPPGKRDVRLCSGVRVALPSAQQSLKFGNADRGRLPDEIHHDPVVLVRRDVLYPCDGLPRHGWNPGTGLERDAFRGFAKHHQVIEHGADRALILPELPDVHAAHEPGDAFAGIAHVLQPLLLATRHT